MGVTKERRKELILLDQQACELYKQGFSVQQISKQLHMNPGKLGRRLKSKYKIDVLPDGKKEVNDSYFCDINNNEKAYWLGFLFADGSVSDKNNIELCLKATDIEQIENFKKTICSNHKIGDKKINLKGKIYYAKRIIIRSKTMADSLKSLGCVPRKSLVIEFPKNLDTKLLHHFIRGYFDGDGTLGFYRNKNKSTSYHLGFSSGSLKFLYGLKDAILDCFGIESEIKDDTSERCYLLYIRFKDNIYKFLKCIYEDSTETTRLRRKYNKYTRLPS